MEHAREVILDFYHINDFTFNTLVAMAKFYSYEAMGFLPFHIFPSDQMNEQPYIVFENFIQLPNQTAYIVYDLIIQ